jgi:pentatricopeptide repeat protein
MLLHKTCWLVGSVKREGVGKLMDQMKSVGINPKLITYNTLIYGFCNVGNFDKASCLFDQLKSIDQSPTLVTYIVLFAGLYMFKIRVLSYKRLKESETLVLTQGLALNLFSYDELKRATNGFKDMLGKGSFGTVYKGALYKGKKLVAVKRLEKLVEEGEREFCAEMRAIGRTHHKNLVQLLGCCAEGSKRLLVYEFMSNGSLADVLFRGVRHPDWGERVRIALDVARGILYLHEECKAPIIHCDIKPQNILMDEFWTAKIFDFGLAKLLMPDQTRTFIAIRGTRGYLAPEWHKNTPILVKTDVYSYRIVLLKIVCCRRNMEVNESRLEEILLSTWVYKCFVARELDKIVGGEEIDKTSLENIVKVGLWCIQEEPHLRPSMKSVVLMLEGIIDISVPACPTNTS